MKSLRLRSLCFAAALLFLFATGAFADVNLVFSGVNGNDMGGVYTSPYLISVNGATPVYMICIDFATEVYTGSDGWNASVQTFTPPTGALAEAAVLASWVMGDYATTAGAEQSYAIWSLFDSTLSTELSNAYGAQTGTTTAYGSLTKDQVAGIEGYLQEAQSDSGAAPNLTLYSPVTSGYSQRFIQVSVPEPSFIALLGVDLLGVFGLISITRRKMRATR